MVKILQLLRLRDLIKLYRNTLVLWPFVDWDDFQVDSSGQIFKRRHTTQKVADIWVFPKIVVPPNHPF